MDFESDRARMRARAGCAGRSRSLRTTNGATAVPTRAFWPISWCRAPRSRRWCHFDRNGFAYTIDRASGKILLAEKYGPANWARTVDSVPGIPQRDPAFAAPATSERRRVPEERPLRPARRYVHPASEPSRFSRRRSRRSRPMFFVPLNNLCMNHGDPGSQPPGAAGSIWAASPDDGRPGRNRGRFIAWDATTGTIAWENREPLAVAGGRAGTAGRAWCFTAPGRLAQGRGSANRPGALEVQDSVGHRGESDCIRGPGRQGIHRRSAGIGGWWGLGGNGAFPDLVNVTTPGGVLMVFGL